jgi:serine/threonine-protein kinase
MSDIPQALASALADRYVLEREVGSGGMATVYLARDLRHKRSVALKVVRPELGRRASNGFFVRSSWPRVCSTRTSFRFSTPE